MKIFLPWPGYIMNTRNKIYFKLIVIQSRLASYNKMRKFEYFAYFTSFFLQMREPAVLDPDELRFVFGASKSLHIVYQLTNTIYNCIFVD